VQGRSVQLLDVVGGDVELGGGHPAADVDADRRGHDRAQGGDDRADGGAHAEVRVGHQGQVRMDERHRRRPDRLVAGRVRQDRRPVQQPLVDLLGHAAPLGEVPGERTVGRRRGHLNERWGQRPTA